MRINKKSIMGPVISVFVLVLVISILAGLTFLFVSQLKAQAANTAERTTVSVANETIAIADLITGISVDGTTALDANSFTLTGLLNATGSDAIGLGNATLTTAGVITNSSGALEFPDGFNVSYTYTYIAAADAGAYNAVNDTEAAGAGIVSYLPLIFLALIFGAILTLVLKIILPYINLGKDMGGF